MRALEQDAAAAIARLRRDYGVDDAVLATLRAFHPVAAPHFPRLAREFYERIREHEGAHDVLTGERQIERLQRSMVRWLERLFLSPRGAEHVDEALRIARRHAEVGLAERYVLVATTLLRIGLSRIAEALATRDAPGIRDAIERALDLELALSIETYQALDDERLRRLEARLREARAVDRSVHARAIERAPCLVVGLDERSNVLFANAAAEAAIGRARETLAGRPFREVFPAFGDGRMLRFHFAQLEEAPRASWDDELARVAFGRDVTDEERDAGRALHGERRSAELTLATGLAHEIRNPLNGARLHATVLERTLRGRSRHGADAELAEAATMLRDSLGRLADLLDLYLEIVRPTPLSLEEVSPEEVCRGAVEVVAARLEGSGASVRIDVAEAPPRVRLDRGRVVQALAALVENAVDAIAGGAGTTITLRSHAVEAPFVAFDVEDDGPGLPFPDAPVLDAFWTTKRGAKGLGLTLACRIATDHGGRLGVVRASQPTIVRMLVPDAPCL